MGWIIGLLELLKTVFIFGAFMLFVFAMLVLILDALIVLFAYWYDRRRKR